MAPGRPRAHPWLERRRHLERLERGGVRARRSSGSFLDASVGGEVGHREARRALFRPEGDPGPPLEAERDLGERRQRPGFHDRPPVRPDRHARGGVRADPRRPAPRRYEDALATHVAVGGAHADDAIALAQERGHRAALHEMSARGPPRRAEPGDGRERIAVPIALAEPSAAQVVDADLGDELADPDPVDHLDRHAEPLVERERPAQLRHALLRLRDEEVAALGEVVARAGAVFELAPEGGRELRETHVELVDELVTDAAESAFRGARAETIAFFAASVSSG